eukprot:CAMPEP_0179915764 /NCGR_PEP_ID=MMETSP0983-20121128/1862_1 /TAXON_ID=483367 /ORGANISM="non described non described, Strain CCMP 2436" /LENGTH=119 /DNA_ID=CAMNT_0021818231 /DNA_START=433 /DNA_END=792 /DNA_ORIENTATION=-
MTLGGCVVQGRAPLAGARVEPTLPRNLDPLPDLGSVAEAAAARDSAAETPGVLLHLLAVLEDEGNTSPPPPVREAGPRSAGDEQDDHRHACDQRVHAQRRPPALPRDAREHHGRSADSS